MMISPSLHHYAKEDIALIARKVVGGFQRRVPRRRHQQGRRRRRRDRCDSSETTMSFGTNPSLVTGGGATTTTTTTPTDNRVSMLVEWRFGYSSLHGGRFHNLTTRNYHTNNNNNNTKRTITTNGRQKQQVLTTTAMGRSIEIGYCDNFTHKAHPPTILTRQRLLLLETLYTTTSRCYSYGRLTSTIPTQTRRHRRLQEQQQQKQQQQKQPPSFMKTRVGSDHCRRRRWDRGFLEQWIQSKERLLAFPLGSFQIHHWNQAEELMKQLRIQKTYFARDINRIQDGFHILDRMVDEIQHSSSSLNNNKNDKGQTSNNNKKNNIHHGQNPVLPSFPLEYYTLAALMVTWRDFMILSSKTRSMTPTTTSMTNSISSLDPWNVLKTVDRCAESGLFVVGNTTYNIILHVLAKRGSMALQDDKQSGSQTTTRTIRQAEKLIWEPMMARSRYNPLDTVHHPDTHTICHMVDLWLRSGIQNRTTKGGEGGGESNNIYTKAEEYLATLQQWYQETGYLSNYRPSSQLYCLVMEAQSRSNHPTAACDRIIQLFEQMKKEEEKALRKEGNVVGSDNSLISYSRTCHALAHVRHPEHKNVYAARAILDGLCESLLNHKSNNHQDQEPATQQHYYGNRGGNERGGRQIMSLAKTTQVTFLAVLLAYGRAGLADEAQKLFDYMERLVDIVGDPTLRPDLKTYSTLIWAHARVGDTAQAEAVLVRLLEAVERGQLSSGDYAATNDGRTITTDQQQEQQPEAQLLSSKVWAGVMASYAESDDPNATKIMLQLMERIRNLTSKQQQGNLNDDKNKNNNNSSGLLNVHTYNVLLSGYARQKDALAGAQEAERLLEWMEDQSQKEGNNSDQCNGNKNEALRPDGRTYLAVIQAWSNAGVPDRSEFYIRKLYDNIVRGNIPTNAMTVQHFNCVIAAWNKAMDQRQQQPQEAINRIRAQFEQMKKLGLRPNVVTYNSYLWALARKNQQHHTNEKNNKKNNMPRHRDAAPSSIKEIMEVFDGMNQQWKNGDVFAKPDSITYNAVLTALSRSTSSFTEHDPEVMDKAEDLFREMKEMDLHRNTKVYATFMTLCVKHNRPDRAEELYQELRALYKEHGDEALKPDIFLHRTRLNALAKRGNPEQATAALREWIEDSSSLPRLRPTNIDFTTVLSAWVRSGRHDAYDKVERGIERMIELSNEGEFDCRPNAVTFVTAMSTCVKLSANLPNPGEKAQKLFDRLKHLAKEWPQDDTLRPNSAVYNVLMSAWMEQNQPERVEQVFQEAIMMNVKSSKLYSNRLVAWTRAGNAEMATHALNDWISNTELTDRVPNVRQFHSVLFSWSQSNDMKGGEMAEQILRQMLQLISTSERFAAACHPDEPSFTAVISAHAKSRAPNSGERARSLLEEMKSRARSQPLLEPSFMSYAWTIEAMTLSTPLSSSSSSEDLSMQHSILQYLDELQKKHASFWQRHQTPWKSLETIRTAIYSSSFPARIQMLEEYGKLVKIARAATEESHHQSFS